MDLRFESLPRKASGQIAMVEIDSPSIQTVGVWPWPREIYADLIGTLRRAGSRDIFLDVDFSSPSNRASDETLARALNESAGSVILAAFKQWVGDRGKGNTLHVNLPLPEFAQKTWIAVVNVVTESDAIVRRYGFGDVLEGKFVPSAGAIMAGRYDSKSAPFWIDFGIRANSIPIISFADVLRGDPAALAKVKDKTIIVGASAIELGDRFGVPNGQIIPGALLQALAAESIIQDRALRMAHPAISCLAGAVVLFLMMLLWRRASAPARIVLLGGIAATSEIAALVLQQSTAIVLDTSILHLACAAYLVAIALDEIDFRGILTGIAENRFQRVALSLGDGLVCADRDGRITFWNPGAAAIFGYQPAEIAGRTFDTIVRTPEGAEEEFSLLRLPRETLNAPGGKLIELEGLRKNGRGFPLEVCFSVWEGVDGIQYGAVMRDISARKRETEKIRYLAEHDTLTELANRNKLYAHLNTALRASNRQGSVALLILDLDKFKHINDALGHVFGDKLLRAVAGRLNALARPQCLVARLGGDEFAIVISGSGAAERAQHLSAEIAAAFATTPMSIDDRPLFVTVSIGVATFPEYCASVNELFDNADLALYRAKNAGRNRFVIFEHSIRDELESRLTLEAALEDAITNGELELFYQPQVRLSDRRLAGAEALIRWRHAERGLLSPADFMPLVNSSPMSCRVARWVMETACRQGRKWQQQGFDLRIGVNLSPSQLQSGDLQPEVAAILQETGFAPHLLELEVTEDILLDDDALALDSFKRTQSMGVRIAFDDFGTGFASMTYLKKYPLDTIKIDRSFVAELASDSESAAIVRCTVDLGKSLGLLVIAEGVEDIATCDLLARMGCGEGQGYLFGAPMPAGEFERRFFSGNPTFASAGVASAA